MLIPRAMNDRATAVDRLIKAVVSQFAKPRGMVGSAVGFILAKRRSNVQRGRWTIQLGQHTELFARQSGGLCHVYSVQLCSCFGRSAAGLCTSSGSALSRCRKSYLSVSGRVQQALGFVLERECNRVGPYRYRPLAYSAGACRKSLREASASARLLSGLRHTPSRQRRTRREQVTASTLDELASN